jgi:hypothetical protein
MADSDFPAPPNGFVLTRFLVVSDQDRSREFYQSVFGATVVLERDPVILKLANSWLILNVGGGPTDDKPAVTLTPPADPGPASAFLNIRWPTSPRPTRNGPRRALSSSLSPRTTAARSAPTSATPMVTSSRSARQRQDRPGIGPRPAGPAPGIP